MKATIRGFPISIIFLEAKFRTLLHLIYIDVFSRKSFGCGDGVKKQNDVDSRLAYMDDLIFFVDSETKLQ